MKDLHIVIVNWNVKDELRQCLLSLEQACNGLDWECVVVDNASHDGSAAMVRKEFFRNERIDLLENRVNLGFAAANNQGAVQHKARHVLLLNPDTVCPPHSLARMVRFLDAYPDIGILGPKLLNADQSYQPSVRRFPSLADQMMIMLKLHHVFPKSRALHRYFAEDIAPDQGRDADQVMGACFMVRAKCWDQMRGLDDRYFIWFEEVDACKQAIKNGWRVWYEPSISVMHAGGQSFAKAFTWKKQRIFNRSLIQYMRKWHGGAAAGLFYMANPISLCLAAVVGIGRGMKELTYIDILRHKEIAQRQLFKQRILNSCRRICLDIFIWIFGIFVFETASFWVFQSLFLRSVLSVFIALAMIYTAYRKPSLALAVCGVEIWIGGFGYLLAFHYPGLEMGFSLRMVLMAGFFIGWGINALRSKVWRFWRLAELMTVQAWIFMAFMISVGTVHGWWHGFPLLYADANAWVFLAYLIPVLDLAHRDGSGLRNYAVRGFIAAAVWLPLKAFAVLYVFSHGFVGASERMYTWIRDTRVGEITPAGGNVFRVFFQSAIFSAVITIFLFSMWIERVAAEISTIFQRNFSGNFFGWVGRRAIWILWVISMSMILISLSRSFWVGTFAGLVVAGALGGISLRKFPWRASVKAVLASVFALGLAAAVIYFPIPRVSGISMASMFAERGTVADPAGSSRWNLLPVMWEKIKESPILGHGLGSTVTYQTLDPRILKNHPDGLYTTSAFEWGWLSLWIKFGIFGPLVLLWLLGSLGWRSWNSDYALWLRLGIVGSLVALSAVHVFTPYLDHPLGFTVLLAFEGMLALQREEEAPAYHPA